MRGRRNSISVLFQLNQGHFVKVPDLVVGGLGSNVTVTLAGVDQDSAELHAVVCVPDRVERFLDSRPAALSKPPLRARRSRVGRGMFRRAQDRNDVRHQLALECAPGAAARADRNDAPRRPALGDPPPHGVGVRIKQRQPRPALGLGVVPDALGRVPPEAIHKPPQRLVHPSRKRRLLVPFVRPVAVLPALPTLAARGVLVNVHFHCVLLRKIAEVAFNVIRFGALLNQYGGKDGPGGESVDPEGEASSDTAESRLETSPTISSISLASSRSSSSVDFAASSIAQSGSALLTQTGTTSMAEFQRSPGCSAISSAQKAEASHKSRRIAVGSETADLR
ncbi:MAG: hypothetical protein BJ554DRAFT_5256 [Olpidium bornovanus]|uniref:Uncharacterized protein n=1 Tax=Olpidium bornovanus TaxID=278681 RepID=A0A8H7ZIK2_9FUNG|nr:MAG: hypothetical protein BJ554DRAFT_5256 [Olpidium bornovanus]